MSDVQTMWINMFDSSFENSRDSLDYLYVSGMVFF